MEWAPLKMPAILVWGNRSTGPLISSKSLGGDEIVVGSAVWVNTKQPSGGGDRSTLYDEGFFLFWGSNLNQVQLSLQPARVLNE